MLKTKKIKHTVYSIHTFCLIAHIISRPLYLALDYHYHGHGHRPPHWSVRAPASHVKMWQVAEFKSFEM